MSATISGPIERFDQGVFVVIGAAGGIGRCICRGLVDRGASIAVTSRSEDRLESVADEFGADHRAILDATDDSAVDDFLQKLGEGEAPLAGVVNCAGTILIKPAHLTTPDEFDETIRINLLTSFNVVRSAGKVMKKGGSVVLFSTAAAIAGVPNHEAIAAAKGGVAALARSAASSYAARGLRFNAVAPGLVKTPLAERITSNERSLETSRKMHAMGRVGEPEDCASAALWFLDPANGWATGQVLAVDGGLSRLMPTG